MPKQLPLSIKREWLKEYEDGKSAADIARDQGRALKVIKRGIEEARADRDGIFARTEIVKEALIKHQKQLMEIIKRLMALTEGLPADIELRREKGGSLAPIPLLAGRIVYNSVDGLTVELSDELTPYWGLLKEHLKRGRIWSATEGWKKSAAVHMKARSNLELGIRLLIQSKTGLPVATSEPTAEEDHLIYPFTVRLFYEVNIRKLLGIPDETNPQDTLVATPDGYVLHGNNGSKLAYCLGKQQECRDALVRAFNKIKALPEVEMVTATDMELKKAGAKLKKHLEDFVLMGMVPGRCRICSRISM